MKSFTQLAAIAVCIATAAAQYAINPNSVNNDTRRAWCTSQITQCPLICLQTPGNSATTRSNTCDWPSLTYSCVCSNGVSPNISEYSQTIPFYICQEWGNQCVSNCGSGNSACQSDCRQNHPCGAQNPTRQNTSTLTGVANVAAATTDAAGQTVYDGILGATAAAQTGTNRNAGASLRVLALGTGQTFGSLAIVGFVFGAFAVLL
ncbi:uncharacterized protein K489DRAFT_420370 [Dissoconium aciculare CBS 342.82]|uniref:DUF7707 domain-containing protein n=1 Tax=Dissoconium aciculare CBS 342.82 TaxID=1314786 RepID=A0A6J3LQA9_9PEZI|nr:uncharacterized protein K489DRAFT_420370 [Dissoconium aciculare CBS 342.82]KAF1818086.1 hypothetical protein K489DRAFT_420370 [Dissoconium aciculare CBS 342.82]